MSIPSPFLSLKTTTINPIPDLEHLFIAYVLCNIGLEKVTLKVCAAC